MQRRRNRHGLFLITIAASHIDEQASEVYELLHEVTSEHTVYRENRYFSGQETGERFCTPYSCGVKKIINTVVN